MADVFHKLAERVKRRGMVLVISDFFFDVPALLGAMQHFRHRKHEVVAFHVMAPEELEFPFRQWSEFRNLEDDSDRLRAYPIRLRDGYIEQVRKFIADLKRGCGNMRADYVQLSTETPVDWALAGYLAGRAMRGR
jgi:hypothetical protein